MARHTRLGVVLLLLAAAVSTMSLVGCGSKVADVPATESATTEAPASSDASPEVAAKASSYVKIKDTGFSPVTVNVKVGTKVFWTNHGKQIHNVTIDGGGSSGEIKLKGIAAHVFTEAGTFTYHDALHPDLKGSIVVE